jgi:hypothetical protein
LQEVFLIISEHNKTGKFLLKLCIDQEKLHYSGFVFNFLNTKHTKKQDRTNVFRCVDFKSGIFWKGGDVWSSSD